MREDDDIFQDLGGKRTMNGVKKRILLLLLSYRDSWK